MQIYGTASKKPSRTSSDGFFSSASSPNAEPFLHGAGGGLDANSRKSLKFFIVQLWGWAATVWCKRKVHRFISWAIVWFVVLLITQRGADGTFYQKKHWMELILFDSKTVNSVCRSWSKISCSLVSERSVNFIVHSTRITDTNVEPNGLRK